MTHGTFAVADNDRNMPVVEGRRISDERKWDFSGDGRFFSSFPSSHESWMTRCKNKCDLVLLEQ